MSKQSIPFLGFFLLCLLSWQGSAEKVQAASVSPEELDFREIVRKAKERVFPAVVFVKCIMESHWEGKKVSREMAGSGVLISPDGELLTNHHVVDKATEVRCLLFNGEAWYAAIIGKDKDTDLALLKLQRRPNAPPLPYAALGKSSLLKEGDYVMAMGAPWGLTRSVSIGIISCTRRYLLNHSEYSLWLQTDASICPGNSGGPLVNTAGEVVGINTLGTFFGGDMGFAIPVDTVKVLLPQLREFGRMNWSWTGLQLQPLKDFNRNIYFEATNGVIVAGTDPESPARHAGLLTKDHIISINDKPVDAATEEEVPAVNRELGLLPKNEPARISLIRDGKLLTVDIKPREKGKVEGEELDCPRWDFTVKAINQFDNPNQFYYRQEGVFIYGVKQPGNAMTAGLRIQDIVVSIDGKEVKTLADVKTIHKQAMDKIQTQSRVVVAVLRNGLMRHVVLDFSRDYEKE